MWLQDQISVPSTGGIVSTTTITIYPNDAISISIYRHVDYFDGTARPVLRFVSNGGTYVQNLVWSWNENNWDTLEITCGPGAEPCCLTYPCTGHVSDLFHPLNSGRIIASRIEILTNIKYLLLQTV